MYFKCCVIPEHNIFPALLFDKENLLHKSKSCLVFWCILFLEILSLTAEADDSQA